MPRESSAGPGRAAAGAAWIVRGGGLRPMPRQRRQRRRRGGSRRLGRRGPDPRTGQAWGCTRGPVQRAPRGRLGRQQRRVRMRLHDPVVLRQQGPLRRRLCYNQGGRSGGQPVQPATAGVEFVGGSRAAVASVRRGSWRRRGAAERVRWGVAATSHRRRTSNRVARSRPAPARSSPRTLRALVAAPPRAVEGPSPRPAAECVRPG